MNAPLPPEVHVSGDGSHFHKLLPWAMFDGMSRVKKQQTAIHGPLMAIAVSQPYPCQPIDQSVYPGGRAIVNLTDFKLRVTCR